MLKRTAVLTLLMSLGLLVGCGQKGPLYLPPHQELDDVKKPQLQESKKAPEEQRGEEPTPAESESEEQSPSSANEETY